MNELPVKKIGMLVGCVAIGLAGMVNADPVQNVWAFLADTHRVCEQTQQALMQEAARSTQTILPICNPPTNELLPICVPQEQPFVCPIWNPPDPMAEAALNYGRDACRQAQDQVNEQKNRIANSDGTVQVDPSRYWQLVGQMADSQRQAALADRSRMGFDAKLNANREYRSVTGQDYSSTTVRPPDSGVYQDSYDSCRRVHQIW